MGGLLHDAEHDLDLEHAKWNLSRSEIWVLGYQPQTTNSTLLASQGSVSGHSPPPHRDDSERVELVKELDYLPLAITQAAAYISARATRMTVSKYLTLYRGDEVSQSRLLEDSGDLRRDPGLPSSVIRTWQISFDQIKGKWPSVKPRCDGGRG